MIDGNGDGLFFRLLDPQYNMQRILASFYNSSFYNQGLMGAGIMPGFIPILKIIVSIDFRGAVPIDLTLLVSVHLCGPWRLHCGLNQS